MGARVFSHYPRFLSRLPKGASFMSKPGLKYLVVIALVLLALVALVVYQRWPKKGPLPGTVLDEARQANRPASSFPAADEDYFHDMDGVSALTPEEVKG